MVSDFIEPIFVYFFSLFLYVFSMIDLQLNSFKPSVLFMGLWQTVNKQNSEQPDQTQQNAASDKVLYCSLTECSIEI